MVVIDGTLIQIQVLPPQRDGGKNITSYDVDIDTDLSFQTVGSRTVHYAVEEIPFLHFNDGPLVLELGDLEPGTFYYIRVRAVSSVGESMNTAAENHPIAPTKLSIGFDG